MIASIHLLVFGFFRYWELISQALEPRYHRTPQECSRKAIRLEEEKYVKNNENVLNDCYVPNALLSPFFELI